MQDYYVDMLIYDNMQNIYVDMELTCIYVNMQYGYVDMQIIFVNMREYYFDIICQ